MSHACRDTRKDPTRQFLVELVEEAARLEARVLETEPGWKNALNVYNNDRNRDMDDRPTPEQHAAITAGYDAVVKLSQFQEQAFSALLAAARMYLDATKPSVA